MHRLVVVIGMTLALFAGSSGRAAVISAPATSASGTFSVAWTSGYELRLADANWRIAAPPVKSFSFVDLPPGVYRLVLASCAWRYEWELGYLYSCESLPSSAKSVTVTGTDQPVIDEWTSEAGSSPYMAGVTARGAAEIRVPLRTPEGVNGVALGLALAYDSARGGDRPRYLVDDVLGWGWRLDGVPAVHRCRVGQLDAGSSANRLTLDQSDGLCLDGEPLMLVTGEHWRGNAEYRLATDPDLRVTLRATDGFGIWFEVRYPDGRIGRFGDTASSRVAASGRLELVAQDVVANEPYLWGLRQLQGPVGGELLVDYQKFDGYGHLQPSAISYGGAELRFDYGPRADLAPVTLGLGVAVRRLSILNAVRVLMNGKPLREYRLGSAPDSAGRLRLERVQECGYDVDGSVVRCLAPLRLHWTGVYGGGTQHPVAVSELTDGLGGITGFSYAVVTAGTNPLGYPEAPFGPLLGVAGTASATTAAVAVLRRSDGRRSGAVRRWLYAYKGVPLRDLRGRGFLGFQEQRVTDVQSGVVTYTQSRVDWPFIGRTSQVRAFDAPFGSTAKELLREEHGFAQKLHANGTRQVYRDRSTRWLLEAGTAVGGSIERVSFCYRGLSSSGCPATGTELDAATEREVVTTDGIAVSSTGFRPAFWGDVPVRGIAPENVRRTVTEVTRLQNSAMPWIRGAVTARTVTHAAPGLASRTVTEAVAYLPGTLIERQRTRFPGDPALESIRSRSFDAAADYALSTETVQGVDLVARTWRYSTPYQDGRFVVQASNPLGQTVGRIMDPRFGVPLEIVDADGRTREFEYDPFGRLVLETRPDGTEVRVRYERCDQADCSAVVDAEPGMRVTVMTQSGSTQTAPARVVYLDVLGRQVLREVEAIDPASGWHSQRIGYDPGGRIQYVSRPAAASSAPVCTGPGPDCTWFSYDLRDRVIRENRPDGGSIVTTFSGRAGQIKVTRSETIKAAGLANGSRVRTSTFDVLGQVTQTDDAAETTAGTTARYTYDAHGNLATVAVDDAQVVELEYDLAGNRTRIIDASSGSTRYYFSALGELMRSTDAKAQTTTYGYDLLGRLVSRIDAGGVGHSWR